MPDYVQGFGSVTAGPTHDVAFACNCTLNYVYGKLDGARVGLPGPFTFGEIAYQLLNQTMVYCDVVDAADHRLVRSEEHTSELQSRSDIVCRLLLEKKKQPQRPRVSPLRTPRV